MEIKKIQKAGFEEIVGCVDPDSGLRAFIAIHNTRLGPALGGIRMLPYGDEEKALKDVMDLARAMTYKAAAARLKLGGGKAVIIGNPLVEKTTVLLKVMGQFINQLKGRYIAAKDAGIALADLVEIAKETKYVTGLPEAMGGSGDPSPWTALGILEGIRASVAQKFKRGDLKGLRVAIQGVGAVGFLLAQLLHKENMKLVISDTNPEVLERARRTFKAEVAAPEKIHSVEAEIFSPCALGGAINDGTVRELVAPIVAGGANNQLADEIKHDRELFKRGILYAPDYVINAGGLINIYVRDILKKKDPLPWIRKIREDLREIFDHAFEKKMGTNQAANELTEKLFAPLG